MEWEGGSSHTEGGYELWASPGFPSEMWEEVAWRAEMDRVTYLTERRNILPRCFNYLP